MAVFKQQDLGGLTARRLGGFSGLLIHGDDQANVALVARDLVRKFLGADDRGFGLTQIAASVLAKDPALLATEVQSMSLLGDRTMVWVSDVGEDLANLLKPLLASAAVGNFLLLTTDGLGKTSKLRKLCEEAENFASLALYEENLGQVSARVANFLDQHNLRFDGGARERFFELVGGDHKSALAEIEKLSLYCLGAEMITLADVEAICGDTSTFGVDQIIDGIMGGDASLADHGLTTLEGGAGGMRSVLPILVGHVNRLLGLRMDMARGMTADSAFRSAKPPLFFGRRDAFMTQLRIWDLPGLLKVLDTISQATLQTRQHASLETAVISRCLLSIARLARSARAKAS